MSVSGEDTILLEGHISIAAVLEGGTRPVYELFALKETSNRAVRRVIQQAKARGISVRHENADEIAARAGGSSHGGLLAVAGPRTFVDATELAKVDNPFIVMLDGVEDPFNFGQAVRALYAAGASALVVRPRNWFTAAAIVARASAGASERIATTIVASALEAAEIFRKSGIVVACTAQQAAVPLHECDLSIPVFLLIGGERRGVTRSFREQADLLVNIPYGRSFRQSLGTAASAAVIGFEVLRQRNAGILRT